MADMGLSADDLEEIVAAYRWTADRVYATLLERKKFAWNQFLNNDPYCAACGNCPQPWIRWATCARDLRQHCDASGPVRSRAMLYGWSPGSCKGTNPAQLTEPAQDVANFLLVRGPHAYLGMGWSAGFGGCSVDFEYPLDLLNVDYGVPVDEACHETAPGSGIFERKWSKRTFPFN